MVGLHAASTCGDDTTAAAADLARRHGVGVHVHVNNGVGYANPRRFQRQNMTPALGTDGIGADMLDEFRLASVRAREYDVTVTPDVIWDRLESGRKLFPETANDVVSWNYSVMDPWRLAYTTQVAPTTVQIDGSVVWQDGAPTRVDAEEIKAKAAEAATRLFARL